MISLVLLETKHTFPFNSPFTLNKTVLLLLSQFSLYPLYKIHSSSNKTYTVFLDKPSTPRLPLSFLQEILSRSLRSRRSPSDKTCSVFIPLKPFPSFERRYVLFLLSRSSTPSPFPFEPSFTHAHRGRDHVFYTRVRVRAFVRVRAKIPRFSTESVESHLLLFPTRLLCPPASISAILGSLRSRSTCTTPLHHARTGLVAMILHDPHLSFSRSSLFAYESN